ncbi:MAG: FAD-binding oxidoreductase, partial [Acidobacteriota bacterium]|nr:FAD-binding oxidoreductase [Acidobacteriota bacterium]
MPEPTDHEADSPLAAALSRALEGEVLFDEFSRGRYSTDASMYQIPPVGVVVPRHAEDVVCAIQIAAEHGVPLLPRGAGTSQCGQTVGRALVLDGTKYLAAVRSFEPVGRTISVEPGIVLDTLNDFLEPHGLFFPIDVSTSSRATIGGMAGNNSVGARSIRYGHMVDNVLAIDALMADGQALRFCAPGDAPADVPGAGRQGNGRLGDLTQKMRALYVREEAEIRRRYPKVARNV